jgi:O-antigen/teichoic acid export membrane protein
MELPPFHTSQFLSKKIFKLSPEALWVLVGQAGTSVAGLFGVKVLTNVLGPGEFGMLALANTIVALISTNFLFGPLGQGLMRNWSISQERGELRTFYAVSNRYGLYTIAMSIVVGIGLVAVAVSIKGRDWATLLAVSVATGVAFGWLMLRVSIFTAARQRHWVAFLNIGNAVLKPILAASLVLLIAVSASWAMAGYLVATLGVVFLAERFYHFIVSDTLSSDSIAVSDASGIGKNILSFSWPFAVWGIFNWIHMSCDRWALQTFHSAEVVGAFAVVSQLAIFPLILGSSFLTTLFTPIAYQRAGDLAHRQNMVSANKLLCVMTVVYILGAILLVLLFSVFHYPLVLLISNIQFAEFSFLLPWLTAAWALFYLGQVLSTFGMLANRPKSYIGPKLVSAIVAGISTFYLSARIGPVGVVWGLALAGFVYALWCSKIALKLAMVPLIHKMLVGLK